MMEPGNDNNGGDDLDKLAEWEYPRDWLDYVVAFLDWAVPIAVFLALIIAVALWLLKPADAQELVDANIVTGLDVSSSINAQETMLQVEGMAQAMKSPAVLAAIQSGKLGRIGFAVFVWADGDYPALVNWRIIESQADADAASAEILASLQSLIDASSRSVGTLTNLSGAIEHGTEMLVQAPFRPQRALLNIIGNGEDNVGEDPTRARAELIAAGAVINGVVVGGDPAVLKYYREMVIGGRTAFVLPADKAETLAQIFAMKFVTEIAAR